MTTTHADATTDHARPAVTARDPEMLPIDALARMHQPIHLHMVVCAVLSVAAVARLAPYVAIGEIARALLTAHRPDDRASTVWAWVVIGVVGAVVRLVLDGLSAHIGHNADALMLHKLRSRLGWVRCRWAGTIRQNVLIARPDANQDDLDIAARAARLDEVIDRLPQGWGNRTGEAGRLLSGGEQQRVSIARAFLKNARIVLIDEAASALDPENATAVADAVTALSQDTERIVVVIAHHPTTLAAATRVVTLDAGHVVETGTPDDLRRTGGSFARLYDQYVYAHAWTITNQD
ncbi:hypothetical protein DMP23_09625 [Amycolatopsis sp. A1MSW2902]|uniref:ATP-binding cassette domain-containing protein n=1 Tax=Amycolatopsis sp. A1MSW2902 TaxID=687413 RepID=UPI00307DAC0A